MNIIRNISFIITISLLPCISSCKKLVEISNPTSYLSSEGLFKDDASATSALIGIYSQMVSSAGFGGGGVNSVTVLTGFSSDELRSVSDIESINFYQNEIRSDNSILTYSLWFPIYQYIYTCNKLLEDLEGNKNISPFTKNILSGEAFFMRSFCYFYLINLWGDVPLILTTSYSVNAREPRTASASVYALIAEDLTKAINLLPDGYVDGKNQSTSLRIRPNSWTAKALLSRVELFQGHWESAATLANEIIEQSTQYSLASDLNSVFLNTSQEAIWQLEPNVPNKNTNEAEGFIPDAGSVPYYAVLTPNLYSGFEAGDLRKKVWVDSIEVEGQTYYFPYKYKFKSGAPSGEYSTIFRLAEEYLIRAEANINSGDIVSAISDLNTLRARARDTSMVNALPPLSQNLSALEAKEAVMNERRSELFTEGQRWFDLKRLKQADAILGALKASWNSTDTLYPIPQYEISSNNLITQNPGY